MEKVSGSWKTIKGTRKCFWLKKDKKFCKMQIWSCLKNGKREWNKRWNCYSVKFLVQMKKCVYYICIKTKRTFWLTQYLGTEKFVTLFIVIFALLCWYANTSIGMPRYANIYKIIGWKFYSLSPSRCSFVLF